MGSCSQLPSSDSGLQDSRGKSLSARADLLLWRSQDCKQGRADQAFRGPVRRGSPWDLRREEAGRERAVQIEGAAVQRPWGTRGGGAGTGGWAGKGPAGCWEGSASGMGSPCAGCGVWQELGPRSTSGEGTDQQQARACQPAPEEPDCTPGLGAPKEMGVPTPRAPPERALVTPASRAPWPGYKWKVPPEPNALQAPWVLGRGRAPARGTDMTTASPASRVPGPASAAHTGTPANSTPHRGQLGRPRPRPKSTTGNNQLDDTFENRQPLGGQCQRLALRCALI